MGFSSVLFPLNGLDTDELVAELWEAGTTGILEEPAGLRAYFPAESPPAALLSRYASAGVLSESDSLALDESGCPCWEPIPVGKRFLIAPAHAGLPVPGERLRISVDAGQYVFGTGRHESTQLCLEALEALVCPGQTLADVGCGSGLLALAARHLGAGAIVACDIDGHASAAAHRLLSGHVFQGSVASIRSRSADLVVANLTRPLLDQLASELNRIVRRDGRLVVAGFLAGDPPQQFRPASRTRRGEWECWICLPAPV